MFASLCLRNMMWSFATILWIVKASEIIPSDAKPAPFPWKKFADQVADVISALDEFQKQLLDTEALGLWLPSYSRQSGPIMHFSDTENNNRPISQSRHSPSRRGFWERSALREQTLSVLADTDITSIRPLILTAAQDNAVRATLQRLSKLKDANCILSEDKMQFIMNGIEVRALTQYEEAENRSKTAHATQQDKNNFKKFQQFKHSVDLLKSAFAELKNKLEDLTSSYLYKGDIEADTESLPYYDNDLDWQEVVEKFLDFDATMAKMKNALETVEFIKEDYAVHGLRSPLPCGTPRHRHGDIVTLNSPLFGGISTPMCHRGADLTEKQEQELVWGRDESELVGEICAVVINKHSSTSTSEQELLFAVKLEGPNLQHAQRVLTFSSTTIDVPDCERKSSTNMLPLILWVRQDNLGQTLSRSVHQQSLGKTDSTRGVNSLSFLGKVASGLSTRCIERHRRPLIGTLASSCVTQERRPLQITDNI